MKITEEAVDEVILGEIGRRLAQVRLGQNLTQAQVAERAGVSKRTVERLETGGAAPQLTGFIRICRALGMAKRFELLVPEREATDSLLATAVTSTEVARGGKRRRASAARGAGRAERRDGARTKVEGRAPPAQAQAQAATTGETRVVVAVADGQGAPSSVVVVAHELN